MSIRKIAYYISVAGLFTSSLFLQGSWFGGGYSKISCKDLRSEIVDLTVEQQDSNGYVLIKIYDPTEISRTQSRVVCKGLGSFTTGEEIPIKYEVYKDREEEWMLTYEEYLDDYSKISCKDLRSDIEDETLIKIYDPTEISRTQSRVICEGLGSFSDGEEIPIKYEVYKDREGEWMLSYEQIQ